MPERFTRLAVCLAVATALSLVAHAHASNESRVAAFGNAVAAEWSGVELACPPGSHEWLLATPESLYCFRVELSGLSIRARLSAFLERRGVWLNTWQQETPQLTSRPLWADGGVFRIIVASSLAAPRSSVVFISHTAVD
jgi:hypothetical protein